MKPEKPNRIPFLLKKGLLTPKNVLNMPRILPSPYKTKEEKQAFQDGFKSGRNMVHELESALAESEAKLKAENNDKRRIMWHLDEARLEKSKLEEKLAEKDKEIAELKEALKFNEKARDIDFAEIARLKREKVKP